MRYICSLCIHGDDEHCDEFENGCCDHFRLRKANKEKEEEKNEEVGLRQD